MKTASGLTERQTNSLLSYCKNTANTCKSTVSQDNNHQAKFKLTQERKRMTVSGTYRQNLVQQGGDWVGPLPAVPDVTIHPSTASVPTSYYSMCSLKG